MVVFKGISTIADTCQPWPLPSRANLSISPAANPRYLLCRSDEWLEQTPAKLVKASCPALWTLQGCKWFFLVGHIILILIHSSRKHEESKTNLHLHSARLSNQLMFFLHTQPKQRSIRWPALLTLPLFAPVSIHFPLRGIIDKDSKRGVQQGWLVYLVCLILTGPCTTGEKVCPPLDGLRPFATVQHWAIYIETIQHPLNFTTSLLQNGVFQGTFSKTRWSFSHHGHPGPEGGFWVDFSNQLFDDAAWKMCSRSLSFYMITSRQGTVTIYFTIEWYSKYILFFREYLCLFQT